MESLEGLIVEATPSDTRLLAQVRHGFTAHDVSERFRWLAETVDGTWLLLKTAGRIVGWAVVVWSGKLTHPEYPDIQDVYILPEVRNAGFGTFLIQAIERLAEARGYGMIGLAVNPRHNQAARRLYERLGYRHDGGAEYLDGVYNDFEDWVIDLEKPPRR